MSEPLESQRNRLLAALGTAWARSATAKKYSLQFLPDQIKSLYGGWVVPVVSNADNGDAYELVRGLFDLEGELDRNTQLSVSLMLDPGFPD